VVQQQNAAVPRPRRRCDSVHPLHFCPCGVVQTTCLPLMQEITGAKPVRDARFHLRFTNCDLRFCGGAQAPRCTAFREANVSCGHLTCRTWEVHSGWVAPVLWRSGRTQVPPQSSQRSGRFHTPAVPRAALGTATIFGLLAEALPTSFVRKSRRGSTGGRLHCWLMVQS
jgi:hypothetical protein